jgi:hypothetical protein
MTKLQRREYKAANQQRKYKIIASGYDCDSGASGIIQDGKHTTSAMKKSIKQQVDGWKLE